MEKTKTNRGISIYCDGCFDLVHLGHYNAIRQAAQFGNYLVCGVAADAEILANKGPPILNVHERAEIMRHCKFVDEVQIDIPYTPSLETLKSFGCDFYAHGDDPAIDCNGVDVTTVFRENNCYKEFKRTEGVSTTDTTGKLLALADYDANNEDVTN